MLHAEGRERLVIFDEVWPTHFLIRSPCTRASWNLETAPYLNACVAESAFVLNLADVAPAPEQTVAANELRAALIQAISDLPNNLRTVVLLREFQGLTNEETVHRLGLTIAGVKARVFHARRWLRRRLERELKQPRNGSLISECKNAELAR